MKKRDRIMLVVALAVTLVTLLAVAAPSAFAGQVTKIQYPQQSVDTYEVTMPSRGTISARLEWTDLAGNPIAGWPTSEIDLEVQGDGSGGPYSDLSDKTWYSGLNPTITGTIRCDAGQTFWVSVMPWLGDLKYTLTIYNNGTAVAGYPKTGTAYGAGGEIFIPNDGSWISCIQWWAGSTGNVYGCWNDYVYERIPGTVYDTLSEQYVDTFIAPQPAVRATIGGGSNPKSNKWYTVAPEIWPSAANVGNATVDWPVGAQYPKPGSLTWNGTGASAVYTYSYPDASVTGNPVAYLWGSQSNAGFSRRNVCLENSPSAQVSVTFTGDTLKLIHPKTSASGYASVKVDGVEKGPIDMYASPTVPKFTSTINALGAGPHTVVIKPYLDGSGNPVKNAASTGWAVWVDAIEAPTDAADPTPLSENNLDGNFTYKWTNQTVAGNGFSVSAGAAAVAAFTFTGTQVEYKYLKGPGGGRADVYIDGNKVETVDYYAATGTFNVVSSYGSLTDEIHTLMIRNAGSKTTASTNTYVYIDGFRVNGAGSWYEN